MHLVIFYDVSSDAVRRRVVTACEDYGLDRTQFSAFVGDLTMGQQRELMRRLTDLLGDSPGALLLIPVRADEWKRRIEVRQNAPGDGISTYASAIADRETPDGQLY